MLRGTLGALVLVILLGACGAGDGDGRDDDAGADDAGTGDTGVPPPGELPSGADLAEPAPAALPSLSTAPCPDGWRATADGAGACDPWPASGEATCIGADEAHFPGTPGCARLGPACPASGWPEPTPAGPVLYVRAGAAPGGDGTLALPFATLADATAVATAGATIAVAAGDYDEPVTLASGITLLGACAAGTHVTDSMSPGALATIDVTGTDVVIRNLTISGARAGLLVDMDAAATVEDVIVDRATECGVRVWHGAVATLREVIVRDTQTDPTDGISALGLVVELGAHADATRMVIDRSGLAGVVIDSPDTALVLRDSVIRDTHRGPSGQFGDSAIVQRMGQLTFERVVAERSHDAAVVANQAGSRVEVHDSILRDVESEVPEYGFGAFAIHGGALVIDRTLIERVTSAGVLAVDGSSGEIRDSIVRDVRPDPKGDGGAGIGFQYDATGVLERVLIERVALLGLGANANSNVRASDLTVRDVTTQVHGGVGGRAVTAQAGGILELDRVHIERATQGGLYAIQGFAEIHARDVVVLDTRADLEGRNYGTGFGLVVFAGASAEVERMQVSGSIGWGVLVNGLRAELIARDLRVSRTASLAMPLEGSYGLGRGLEVQGTAHASIERAIIEENRDVGIAVVDGSTCELRDIVVRDTGSDAPRREGGDGLMAIVGAQVTIDGARFSGNREEGVLANGSGTLVQMTGIEVTGTLANECAADTCPTRAAGCGVGVYGGAVLLLTDFTLRDNALCGVQVAEGGAMDLADGEVSRHPVGANVQDPAFDVARLSTRVLYVDNERNLDSQALPIPTPSAAIIVDPM